MNKYVWKNNFDYLSWRKSLKQPAIFLRTAIRSQALLSDHAITRATLVIVVTLFYQNILSTNAEY